ncbi:MAG: UvrD-helicase domain-containing protein [bacterium]
MKEENPNSQSVSYLKSLNDKQKEAVLSTDGPLLILAGAGAGKTKTVTHRILHLIHKGVSPDQILAITFTNKAAKEMRERVYHAISTSQELNLPVAEGARPFVSTFHSLGVHILKEHAQLFGYNRNFSIYDRGDSKSAVKEAIVTSGYDPKQYEPGKILGIISREKGNYVSQEEYEAKNGDEYFGGIVSNVWRLYDGILKKDKAFDFDDLLFKAAELLAKNPEIRSKYQQRWKYVHIDEYQDTNKVQYNMAKYLVGPEQNLAVVGDIDQNIYSWRGADIKNILNFEQDYPGAKVVLLEQNYRSTQNILSVANSIISKNIHRREKNLFTENGEGEKITTYTAYDETDEASFVANTVRDLIREGAKASEIAILYRANFQSRALEEAFLTRELPYQLLGTKFYERKEIKDVLSYLKLALNPDQNADIKRVINIPARGIGKVTLLKIMEGKAEELTDSVKIKFNEFRLILKDIASEINRGTQGQTDLLAKKPSEIIKFVLTRSGIEAMYKFGKEEDEERLENVRELVSIATKFDHLTAPEGIEKLIEEASLSSDQDEIKENEAVRLMTVHASKGLEFDTVFISGLEQDLFPHAKMNEGTLSGEESEEERRLFYVALTRARKKLYLSYAQTRTIYGNKQVNIPSEFLNEIEPDFIEQKEQVSGIKSIFIDF